MNPIVLGKSNPQLSSVDASKGLVDRFGRTHRALRVSVTDICNIRCTYCMPEENPEFLSPQNLLSFDEICRFVTWVGKRGVSKIRLTGGEPLVRKGLHELVARLATIPTVADLALTTNAMLLEENVDDLVASGLRRVNISLDTLSEQVFQRISRRKGLQRVLDGIAAAACIPDLQVKLNALVLRDVNLDGVIELVDFAMQRGIQLRFIEFMPLDAERSWSQQRVVTGAELRQLISENIGPLEQVEAQDPSRPSQDYRVRGHGDMARLGFIDSVSQPFCAACDRLRLTADGKVRNCLFGKSEWDVARWLKDDSQEAERQLMASLEGCVEAKHPSHGIEDPNFRQPERPMYQIGG